MTGGEKIVKTITQSDVNEARKSMIDRLAVEAGAEMKKNENLVANENVIPEQILPSTILYVISNPDIGEESSSFALTMTIRYIGVVFDEKELLDRAVEQINSSLPKDEKISSYNDADLMFTIMEYDLDASTASLQVTLPAKSTPLASNPIFSKDNLTGKGKEDIQSYLTKYDEISSAEIKFSPFWVTKAPNLKDHIEIRIQE